MVIATLDQPKLSRFGGPCSHSHGNSRAGLGHLTGVANGCLDASPGPAWTDERRSSCETARQREEMRSASPSWGMERTIPLARLGLLQTGEAIEDAGPGKAIAGHAFPPRVTVLSHGVAPAPGGSREVVWLPVRSLELAAAPRVGATPHGIAWRHPVDSAQR